MRGIYVKPKFSRWCNGHVHNQRGELCRERTMATFYRTTYQQKERQFVATPECYQ